MFKNIRERFLNMVTSRLFVLVVCFTVLCGVLIHRVFDLQIVNGKEYLDNFKLRIRKERSIASTRGNIYDKNGNLLASNELAYNVTIEDVYESGRDKNKRLNETIRSLIQIIEENGDRIVNEFNIVLDKDNNFQFTVSDKQLLRFLADVYGCDTTDKLTYAQQTATPQDVIHFLAGTKKFAIGDYEDPDNKKTFQPGMGYSKEELLKMVIIRYAMSANSFQKYIATTVASDVNEKTVAVVLENSDKLEGVSIAEDTIRKYVDSVYFSHILGYTGKISQDELDELSKENDNYTATDMIGKAGIEQVMETKLQGQKGSEVMYVDNLGKVIETTERTEPVAGNDLYLTIDMNLQKAVYNILEQKIAGILISKIQNVKEYKAGANASASDIKIPIDDVYFALINNNIIDIANLNRQGARETEKEVYQNYLAKKDGIYQTLREELETARTPYKDMSEEYQTYESYIVSMLASSAKGILDESKADADDETYKAWKTDETISLAEYLDYAIAMNWIDVTKIGLESKYASSEEIYAQLVNTIFDGLENNSEFSKKIFRYMVREESLTGRQVCMLLLEQGIIEVSEEEENDLKNGGTSAYAFMLDRIEHLDITPAQLALDPCSGSSVITDVTTGEVLALVTYPGYDTNRLANTIDADYYNQLQNDLARPMWNYATQQKSAPGSTFKMVSAVAGLEEGVINTSDRITCLGTYDKISPPPRCWIASRGTHGPLDVSGGIENSCNYYFYEVGYRLGTVNGNYNSDTGLAKLSKYADMFGLSETSGVEIVESEPEISDFDAVRSAIGQGTNNFTTVGLARYVTTVANSGTCYKLSLLDKLTDTNGNILENYTPEIRNKVDLPDYDWRAIHAGMRGVVERKSYYNDLKVNVAGKTGTAQESKSRANHALFVGFAPYENPRIAIATRVAFGYTSDYAAEISRDVIKYYFRLEDEDSILTGTAARPDAVGTGED